MKNRSLFEEAGYNLTLKLGFSESTAGIVGQLTPGLLSLGAGIWGGLATSATRALGGSSPELFTSRAGALVRMRFGDAPVLTFKAGGFTGNSPILRRVNDILEMGDRALQSQLRELQLLRNGGNRQAGRIIDATSERACGNIVAAVDDYIRTGNFRLIGLGVDIPFISSLEGMELRLNGWGRTLWGNKLTAQEEIVELMLLGRRPPSSAVVMFGRQGMDGHFVNVVNIDGSVWFFDIGSRIALSARQPRSFLAAFDGFGPYAIPRIGSIHFIWPH